MTLQVVPNTDDELAVESLIRADLEAQSEIKHWEAHRQRIQALLRPQVAEGTTLVTDAGSASWQLRKGEVDYKAAVDYAIERMRETVAEINRVSDEYPDMQMGTAEDARRALDVTIDALTEDIEIFRKAHSQSFQVRPALKSAPKPPDTVLEDLTASVEALS